MRSAPPLEDLSWLKDFQRATVDYAFRRLYLDEPPAHRFLVADEVGLGKTLVARGLIDRIIDYHRRKRRRRVDIIYICSNQTIARQNVQKLGSWGRSGVSGVDRITMLPVSLHEIARDDVNLIALTPGTSFKQGQQPGQFNERALLYALLQQIWGRDALRTAGSKRVFYLGIEDNAEAPTRLLHRSSEYQQQLDATIAKDFAQELRRHDRERRRGDSSSLRQAFTDLSEAFGRRRPTWRDALRQQRNAFIGELREALATVAITRLRPDFVILDEFQKFKSLLEDDDDAWASRLARRLFEGTTRGSRATRTLMLSATPYPMYTISDESFGEDHYREFIQVCRFLFNDHEEAERLHDDLNRVRSGLLGLDSDGGELAREACAAVAQRLRRVMVRTERLGSSANRNGMLAHFERVPPELRPEDVRGYLAASAVATELQQPDIIEYWKSSPYILNFMENYALKHAIEDARANGRSLASMEQAVQTGNGLLAWHDLQRYDELEPGNVKLRAFLADLDQFEPWRLLWLPPSLPYYECGHPFATPEARRFTKRLVFSSWLVVPKVIASLVSYEAERRVFGQAEDTQTEYSTMHDRSGYLLSFRLEGSRPAAMTTFAFIYPSPALAALADPLAMSRELQTRGELATAQSVRAGARQRIEDALRPYLELSDQSGQPDQRWYWAAPLLLDAELDQGGLRDWLFRREVSSDWTGDDHPDADTMSGLERHLVEARDWINGDRVLGRVPGDLLDALAELAVGGPAICAIRALQSASGGAYETGSRQVRAGAARIAWAFRSMLNSPVETAIVREWADGTVPFWRAALGYSVDGNLQAVLDEYAHVLRDWLGFVGQTDGTMIQEIANAAAQAISLRTVNYRVDVPNIHDGRLNIEQESMRGRFAIRLSGGRSDDKGELRVDHVRHAFNSPFWPFVLATTSIGQEGLDFHLYCHAVVHWNLPHNPVDLEQREGRVHRFKGHAIRKNVAAAYGESVIAGGSAPVWDRLFQAAEADRAPNEGDLVPYWVFQPKAGGAFIERHVPLIPLSREEGHLRALLRSVATYRLAFGQPRQDDLLAWLSDKVAANRSLELLTGLRVDLSPPSGVGGGTRSLRDGSRTEPSDPLRASRPRE